MNTTNTTTYAVIGATGKTGRRIADLLDAAGHSVRRLARSTVPAFDWGRPEEWASALHGVDRLYAAYVPDLAAHGADVAISRLADVAGGAGVQRIVLLSGRGEAGARRSEQILLDSAVPTTIVRASWFTQNFTEGMLGDVLHTGVLALPAGGIREPFIDVDDIAAVAVEVLTADGHESRVRELTGPELLSFAEVATVLSEISGREVTYVPMEFADFHAAVAAEEGPEMATLLTELCRETLDGRNESTTDGVAAVLGRSPRDLRTVLTEAAAARDPEWIS